MSYIDNELASTLNTTPLDVKKVMNYLQLGANPNLTNDKGIPLLFLLIYAKASEEMLTLIEKYKVNVSLVHPETKMTVLQTIFFCKKEINFTLTHDCLRRLLAAGENPNTHRTDGEPILHSLMLLKDPFHLNWAIEIMVDKYKADINIRDQKTGKTVLEKMLDNPNISLDTCMKMVRHGACPTSEDSSGNSLLSKLVDQDKMKEAEELVRIINSYEASLATPSAPMLYPQLSPAPLAAQSQAGAPIQSLTKEQRFIEKGHELFKLLTNARMTKDTAGRLARNWTYQGHTYTSNNKEMVIAYIQSLPPKEQLEALKLALNKGSVYYCNYCNYSPLSTTNATPLYAFFATQRSSWSQPSHQTGSFKQLFEMHDKLWLNEAYAKETRNEAPEAPEFPIINREALAKYIASLSQPHYEIMIDMMSNKKSLDKNNINRSFTYKASDNKYYTHQIYNEEFIRRAHENSSKNVSATINLDATKESVINTIRNLPKDQKKLALDQALTRGTEYYNFFNTQRGIFAPSMDRGSFKVLAQMKDALVLDDISNASTSHP